MPHRLLNTYLAYISNRAFVYSPHIVHDHNPFAGMSTFGFQRVHSLTLRQVVPPSHSRVMEAKPHLRMVSRHELYRRSILGPICPWWKTIHLSASRTTEALGLDLANDDFLTDMVAWGKKLSEMKEPCIDINDGTLFHWK
jgi:hypothetical protein